MFEVMFPLALRRQSMDLIGPELQIILAVIAE
jgi:hypothetical protein